MIVILIHAHKNTILVRVSQVLAFVQHTLQRVKILLCATVLQPLVMKVFAEAQMVNAEVGVERQAMNVDGMSSQVLVSAMIQLKSSILHTLRILIHVANVLTDTIAMGMVNA